MGKITLDGGYTDLTIDEDNDINKTIIDFMGQMYELSDYSYKRPDGTIVKNARPATREEIRSYAMHYEETSEKMYAICDQLIDYCKAHEEEISKDEELFKLARYAEAWIRSSAKSDEILAENLNQMYVEGEEDGLFLPIYEHEGELTSRIPLRQLDQFGLMNDKVSNAISSTAQTEPVPNKSGGMLQAWAVNKAPKTREQTVVTAILSWDDGDNGITASRRITATDMTICNAIATQYYYNKNCGYGDKLQITPAEIWRLKNGITDSHRKPSPKQLQEIKDSMDKMRKTILTLNYDAERDKGYMPKGRENIRSGLYDGYFIAAEYKKVKTDRGREIECYEVLKMPPLYAYNEMLKRNIYVPFTLKDVSDTTGNEGNTAEITDYLIKEIVCIKNGKRNSTIKYNTIYEKLGIPTPESTVDVGNYKTTRSYDIAVNKANQKSRKKITDILTSFKNKGFIKGFEEIKEGKKITKVKIITFNEIEKKKPKK